MILQKKKIEKKRLDLEVKYTEVNILHKSLHPFNNKIKEETEKHKMGVGR